MIRRVSRRFFLKRWRYVDWYAISAVTGIIAYTVIIISVFGILERGVKEEGRKRIEQNSALRAGPTAAQVDTLCGASLKFASSALQAVESLMATVPLAPLFTMDLALLLDQTTPADVVQFLDRHVDFVCETPHAIALQRLAVTLQYRGEASIVAKVKQLAQLCLRGKKGAQIDVQRSPDTLVHAVLAQWQKAVTGALLEGEVHGTSGGIFDIFVHAPTTANVTVFAQGGYPALHTFLFGELNASSTTGLNLTGLVTISEGQLSLYEMLLSQWILQGSQNDTLRNLYLNGVQGVLHHLVRTAGGDTRPSFTFAGYVDQDFLPVLHPSSCALPSMLARGLRAGVHGAASQGRFTEAQVRRAAEVLSATCLHLYESKPANYLRRPLFATPEGTLVVPHLSSLTDEGWRTTFCSLPGQLLHAFHEMYRLSEDGKYLTWAVRVMQGIADHCRPKRQGANQLQTWETYLEELRQFVLLLLSFECDRSTSASAPRPRFCGGPELFMWSREGYLTTMPK